MDIEEANRTMTCQNCSKYPCEVVQFIKREECHLDWIKIGDKMAKICCNFSRRNKELKLKEV